MREFNVNSKQIGSSGPTGLSGILLFDNRLCISKNYYMASVALLSMLTRETPIYGDANNRLIFGLKC